VLSWTADGFGDDRFYSLLMRVPRSQVSRSSSSSSSARAAGPLRAVVTRSVVNPRVTRTPHIPHAKVVIELVSTSFNTSIVEHLGRAREGAFGTLAKAPLQARSRAVSLLPPRAPPAGRCHEIARARQPVS
jgi:hypothetical protein